MIPVKVTQTVVHYLNTSRLLVSCVRFSLDIYQNDPISGIPENNMEPYQAYFEYYDCMIQTAMAEIDEQIDIIVSLEEDIGMLVNVEATLIHPDQQQGANMKADMLTTLRRELREATNKLRKAQKQLRHARRKLFRVEVESQFIIKEEEKEEEEEDVII